MTATRRTLPSLDCGAMGVLVAVLLLALAAPAQAARPVTIGPGDAPGVAVDAAGTAYVAYNGPT